MRISKKTWFIIFIVIFGFTGYACSNKNSNLFIKAEIYLAEGNYGLAEQLAMKIIEKYDKKYGKNSYEYARSLKLLAEIKTAQENFEESKGLLKKALLLSENETGTDHPCHADFVIAYADLYYVWGKLEEAEVQYNIALSIWEKTYGSNFAMFIPKVLDKLADINEKNGNIKEAEGLRQRRIRIIGYEKLQIELTKKIDKYKNEKKYEEAISSTKEMLELSKVKYGERNLITGVDYKDLAQLYVMAENYESAEVHFKKALKIWEETRGKDHHGVVAILEEMITLYERMDKQKEKQILLNRLNKIKGR